MAFSHDTELALRGAAALVNTEADARDGGDGSADTLRTADDLTRFLREQSWYGAREGDEAELRRVRELRPRLRGWWSLPEAELVAAVNTALAEADAVPQLVDHDDLGWHVHAVPQDAPLEVRMLVEAAMAFVDLVRAGELDRLKGCDADDCDSVVVDLSRNRSRRFCEGGCGNRENVRAYRDRQRDESAVAADD